MNYVLYLFGNKILRDMGFTKRYINKQTISSTCKYGGSISQLFKSDAMVFTDLYSYEIYEMYLQGQTEEELKSKTTL